jgi:hypothetical protein
MAQAGGQQDLGAGSFFGAVQSRREQCGAIFTDLRHTSPRKSHLTPTNFRSLPF